MTASSENGKSDGQPCSAISSPPTPLSSRGFDDCARNASISFPPSASPECSPAIKNSLRGRWTGAEVGWLGIRVAGEHVADEE